jgi:hypothetical protein
MALGVLIVGSALWFSDTVFTESRIVHLIVGGLGFAAVMQALFYLMRRRGWISPRP